MWTLAEAYNRTGLAPVNPANDAVLTLYMNATLAAVENYLDRKFIFDTQSDKFYYVQERYFQLSRFPVENVSSLTVNGKVRTSGHKVHGETGTVMFKGYEVGDEIDFTYTGGYRVFPADLELALWFAFDDFYATSLGGASVSVGEIQSISVPDVGTVRFNTGGSVSANASGPTEVAHLPDMTVSLLQPYRRKAV